MRDRATTADRIIRALSNGPLYDGLIAYTVGTSQAHARRVLRHLKDTGQVTFDGITWRLP